MSERRPEISRPLRAFLALHLLYRRQDRKLASRPRLRPIAVVMHFCGLPLVLVLLWLPIASQLTDAPALAIVIFAPAIAVLAYHAVAAIVLSLLRRKTARG
ncbi:hypothetical protein [Pontivivens ytuae]|uniref:Uncharacterized protein n=1 Tax=Pontivivens ytuae TaxID=2789856 RepID=A0A7S9LR27_9RHOB|nr:hypothetical protein [Pontivivens ytuae]QPH53729.1 hypothetical protein I0K15_18420 [Pontivivens ytuae]